MGSMNNNTSTEMLYRYKATCGHYEPLGYFTNSPCGKCVRKAHRKATGQDSSNQGTGK